MSRKKKPLLRVWPHRAENPTQGQPVVPRADDPHVEEYRFRLPPAKPRRRAKRR